MGKVVFKSTGSRVPPPEVLVSFEAGETVFREGDLGTEMFIIHEGRVEICTGEGDRVTVVATLERGDFFGEMALLDDRPRSATARTVEPTRLVTINGTTFTKMLRDNPEVAVRMMRKLARRLRDTDRLLQDALLGPGHRVVEREAADARSMVLGPERLIHEATGIDFSLPQSAEATIGRSDPVTGIQPDLDLTLVDTQRSISRRHAKILRRGGKFFLVEEMGTVNGTYVAGEKLETGVPRELVAGDEVRCGLVVLRFLAE
jgi:CRP-like cAMP-binding protein